MRGIRTVLLVGILAGLGLCLCSGSADAATASWVTGVEPDLAGTKVYRAPGACSTPGAYALVGTFPKPAASGTLPDPSADGKYCHLATAFDTAANESVFTNTAEFDYNVNPPGAPGLFSVKP